MKIINLTKDSFVEKVADYQSYPDSWNFKGNKPLPGRFSCTPVCLLQSIIAYIRPIGKRIRR